jgi:hypothetical protein
MKRNIQKREIRKHGFKWPLHPQQLLSWFVFFFNFGSYYIIDVISLSFNVGLAVFLSTLYLILSLVVLYLAVLATKTDPTDPTIKL